MTLVEKYAADPSVFVCVMSVYNPKQENYGAVNATFKRWLDACQHQYEEMEGYYKGEKDPDSYFIVSSRDLQAAFMAIAQHPTIDQEAIIIKPIGSRDAFMVYMNGAMEHIGTYQKIQPGTESGIDFYSKVRGTGLMWRYTTDVDASRTPVSEKMSVNKTTAKEYAKIVRDAYHALPSFDPSAKKHWDALNSSNHTLFKRLLSKVDVIFTTESEPPKDTVSIMGKDYKLIKHKDPYSSADEMAADVKNNNRIMISADHSDHPVFSMEDNIVFRAVHDYIVHVLGRKSFGLLGELQAYNLHAKLVPPKAKPAIFTEVVGQVCSAVVDGDFPEQKVAVMKGFDYDNVGKITTDANQN